MEDNDELWAMALALLLIGMTATALALPGYDIEQANPTEQQQTIDAAVAQFFTQTAKAEQQIGATRTLEAAFAQALTGTARAEASTFIAILEALPTLTPTATPTVTPTVVYAFMIGPDGGYTIPDLGGDTPMLLFARNPVNPNVYP